MSRSEELRLRWNAVPFTDIRPGHPISQAGSYYVTIYFALRLNDTWLSPCVFDDVQDAAACIRYAVLPGFMDALVGWPSRERIPLGAADVRLIAAEYFKREQSADATSFEDLLAACDAALAGPGTAVQTLEPIVAPFNWAFRGSAHVLEYGSLRHVLSLGWLGETMRDGLVEHGRNYPHAELAALVDEGWFDESMEHHLELASDFWAEFRWLPAPYGENDEGLHPH